MLCVLNLLTESVVCSSHSNDVGAFHSLVLSQTVTTTIRCVHVCVHLRMDLRLLHEAFHTDKQKQTMSMTLVR